MSNLEFTRKHFADQPDLADWPENLKFFRGDKCLPENIRIGDWVLRKEKNVGKPGTSSGWPSECTYPVRVTHVERGTSLRFFGMKEPFNEKGKASWDTVRFDYAILDMSTLPWSQMALEL